MIQINLKRKEGNNDVTFGILEIPQYQFKCSTMELKDSSDLMYKQNCRVPEGTYILERSVQYGSVFFPRFKKKPKGFAVKPSFVLEELSYTSLATGMIAIGRRTDDSPLTFALEKSEALNKTFKEIFEKIFMSGDMVVLNIWKGRYYKHTDASFEQLMNEFNANDWIDDDDE